MTKNKIDLRLLNAHLVHTGLGAYGTHAAIQDLAPLWRFSQGVYDEEHAATALHSWQLFGGEKLGCRVVSFGDAMSAGGYMAVPDATMRSWPDAISNRGALRDTDVRLRNALQATCNTVIVGACRDFVLRTGSLPASDAYTVGTRIADNLIFLTFNFLRFACCGQVRRALGFRAAIAATDIGLPYDTETFGQQQCIRLLRLS